MDSVFRQVIRHSAVYGSALVLGRLASIALLPVYTHYLLPRDYGTIALIDLTVSLLSMLCGGGIATAAIRADADGPDGDNARRSDAVWWTALAVVGVGTMVIVVPAIVVREPLAAALFGQRHPANGMYLALALTTLLIGNLSSVLETYFRSRKASTFLLRVSVIRLALNVALNVTFLAAFDLGVAGILLGNLITIAVAVVLQGRVFLQQRGPLSIDRSLTSSLAAFGWPLVVTGIVSVFMHEANRYILNVYLDLTAVGLYSIAHQIAQGVNTLVLLPFASIWSVLIYEIRRGPQAARIYGEVFRHFAMGLALILFLTALAAEAILELVAPPAYAAAAGIVPIVCLAYWLFSLHEHFKVPALVNGRTVAMLPAATAAAVVAVVLNVLLIPRLGVYGAAWASVATFAVFSFGGLLRYRMIERYEYPLITSALVIAGMGLTYMLAQVIGERGGPAAEVAFGAVAWIAWVLALFHRQLRGARVPEDLMARVAQLTGDTRN